MTTETSHRPWELPGRPWVLAMRWHDLLFMHWPVRFDALRVLIPPSLTLDTFDGMAWIGVVPFRMTGVRPRLLPALPWLSAFPELNVRTYVTTGGKPGVWFFSLDAANPLAVRLARWLFHLPYYDARMASECSAGQVHYTCHRTHRGGPPAAFQGRFRPIGPIVHSSPGMLDHWLTERYCLYSMDRQGRVWRGDIHHARWPLQPAEADVSVNTMTQQIGLSLPAISPLLHFARCLDVVGWTPERA
ncbi:MAG TPA: DUF2071 domain-containing protein [Candidatus Tectomicrobia bacterium]|nr:DUF2071 domain-containing protein [Candidatus Tectomicrobia bacterium]